MNYQVRAFKIVPRGVDTQLESYEKDVLNYSEAEKEYRRLSSLGEYTHIHIYKAERINNKIVYVQM